MIVSCPTLIDLNGIRPQTDSAPSPKTCEAPHTDGDLAHYVIVRGNLTAGQQCAQIIHAVGESIKEPHPPNTIAVALKADDEAHLMRLHEKLKKANIFHHLISECDGELMALGIEPTRNRAGIRKVVSSLPLIK